MSVSEELQPQPDHINIKVVNSEGHHVYFKIKPTTQLGKLMDVYASRSGKSAHEMRFIYDGVKIKPHDTPLELDMSDEDKIEVMLEQVGGTVSSPEEFLPMTYNV